MDPMTIAYLLSGAGGATSLLGNIFAKPQETTFDPQQIIRMIEASYGRRLSSQAGSARRRAGIGAEARGMRGGAAAQIVEQAEAPLRASFESAIPQISADLFAKKSMLDDQYNANKSDWLKNIFGDLGGTMGAIGGAVGQREMMNDLLKKLLSGELDDPYKKIIAANSPNGMNFGGRNAESPIDWDQFKMGMLPMFGS